MNNLSINREKVKHDIETAFSNVQFPGDECLLDSSCQDETDVNDFKSKNWITWQDIPEELIDRNYCSLPFFSSSALIFFAGIYDICIKQTN